MRKTEKPRNAQKHPPLGRGKIALSDMTTNTLKKF
jgi:hypothetical protein